MVKAEPDWRASRRASARDSIVAAAWELVEREGLAALAIRDLAKEAGITTPTVYAYFDSKNAIYDAMFGRAASDFKDYMAALEPLGDPRGDLVALLRHFAGYCAENAPRYQLLFQRTIPGFEPTPESYAYAIAALSIAAERLHAAGITEQRHLDLWTAISIGLVDQQIANDPNGDRWLRLIDETVDMYLAHCTKPAAPTRKRAKR